MKEETLKAIDRAFKALEEREELLDKIKAEIRKGKYAEKKGLPERSLIYANGWDDGLEVAISIIDKYKE